METAAMDTRRTEAVISLDNIVPDLRMFPVSPWLLRITNNGLSCHSDWNIYQNGTKRQFLANSLTVLNFSDYN